MSRLHPAVAVALIAATVATLFGLGWVVVDEDRRNDQRSDQIVEMCSGVGGTESRQACVDTWHEEFFG